MDPRRLSGIRRRYYRARFHMGRFHTVVSGTWLSAAPAQRQAVGASIVGSVTDDSGARLPGATISITNLSNGRSQTLVTGELGEYRAVALQPSAYRIVAERHGFKPAEQIATLTVGSDATLDFRLGLEGLRETVTVAPTALSVELAQSQPSSVVTDAQIRSLPEIGRNFLVLAQLLPGSAPLNASVTRFATTKFGGAADQRSGFTTLIDGGDVDDAQWGSPTINLTQESVQEFKVFRNQFDAQYGNALNTVVSVVTKSGGNRAAGSAFYFGRDDALNARNPFAPEEPPFSDRRFGGSAGGPLVRDRAHLFATYESDAVDTVRIVALPASSSFAARENGNFPSTSDDRMAVVKFDHRFSTAHSALIRYAYANQSISRLNLGGLFSDTTQVDTFSRAHSVIAEDDWMVSSQTVNTLRLHWFSHRSGGVPHRPDRGVAEIRPTVYLGLWNGGDWLDYPRTEIALADTIYASTAAHDMKIGGEFSYGVNELRGHFFEDGLFRFQTDAPFKAANPATWPISFLQQAPNTQTYRSRQLALFVQDDWRATDRLRLNVGLRYDLDPTLRINDIYARALANPTLAGLDAFVTPDRGTDTNNLQPRIGATFDVRGDGTRVIRGGWGMYVTRNRPWFQVRSMNQLASTAVFIEDPSRLKLYPDVAAIVDGGGPRQLGTVIPDDFVESYALNTSVGPWWQGRRTTSLEIGYVHSPGPHQYGTTDRNLPAAGRIGPANPRPSPQFGPVAMLENFTDSWYDALESQLRSELGGVVNLQVSYTLSRSYLDGVDFFVNQRGTQRTPQERGYSPSDQRHNLTTAVSVALPAGFRVSGILKLVSGSPMTVQTGTDVDGDGSPTGDRPPGLPITVGRNDRAAALGLINEFRASRLLPPTDPALLQLDPYRALDFRATKTMLVREGRRLELILEAFNVTNFINRNPVLVIHNMTSPQFLERTAARDARQIQWGARFVF